MPVEFAEVVERITDAARKVEADGGASPVLVAVVREFRNKLAKAEVHVVDGVPARDAVIELEQAGDSASGDYLHKQRSMWDPDVARDANMCGPKFCSMRITQDVRRYAEAHGVGEVQAIELGMRAKAVEFAASGSEIYRRADLDDTPMPSRDGLTEPAAFGVSLGGCRIAGVERSRWRVTSRWSRLEELGVTAGD